MENLAYDNAGHYVGGVWAAGPSSQDPPGTDDGPSTYNSMLDPMISGGRIFNLDTPACPFFLNEGQDPDLAIHHNSEVYVNFSQHATITLDDTVPCSDDAEWQYEAQVDVDVLHDNPPGNPIVKNNLATGHTDLPEGSHFAHVP
jgi:hypothetical protein